MISIAVGIKVASKAIKNFIKEFIENEATRARRIKVEVSRKSGAFFLVTRIGYLARSARAVNHRDKEINLAPSWVVEVEDEKERLCQ